MLLIITLVCSAVYAALPEVMRIATGVYSRDAHGVSFYIITVSGVFTNFIICGVTLDALAKSVAQLRMRVAIASSFTQLNSKTAASSLGLFHLELQVAQPCRSRHFFLTHRRCRPLRTCGVGSRCARTCCAAASARRCERNRINNRVLCSPHTLTQTNECAQARVEIILSASFAFLVPLSLMLAVDFFFSKTPISNFIVSSFFFCFVVASYLLLCVWNGVKIQAIYRDQDVLLAEQLAIHYRICTTRDRDLHRRLSNLHAAIGKIMDILKTSAGDGVVLSVLGFSINENFSRVLIGGLLSLASAGFSSMLRQSVASL